MPKGYGKLPCECGHGRTIHRPARNLGKHTNPCAHPKCKCEHYRMLKTK